MTRGLYALLAAICVLFSCIPPPQVDIAGEGAVLSSRPLISRSFSKMAGAGELLLSVAGQRYSGDFDAKWEHTSGFSMVIYSPFGGIFASISSDSVTGKIAIQDKEYSVSMDQLVDTLPFAQGQKIDFRQFVCFISGQIVDLNCLTEKPDQIISKRKYQLLSWETDSTITDARIRKKDSNLDYLQLRYKNSSAVIRFSNFRNQIPRSISLKADDKNYFSINYQSMKLNQ